MSSLRKKILYAFGLSNVAILAIALTVYADLTLLRDQIVNSEKLRQFLSATQQMQNHEEIILLYQSPESWFQLGEQVNQMRELFNQYRTFFDEVIGPTQTTKLDEMLAQYRDRIDELEVKEATDNPVTATMLHDMSRGIREIVHQISKEHHESLSQKAHLVSWILVITLTAVIIMGVISAVFISRQVVQPIYALERQLDAMADGKEKKLTLVSDNIEIQSFVQHFNNMLYKQRSQQSQIRHHEKAAALGVLVSGVAHELNNPLSNISTSVQLLMEDDSDAGLRQQWLAHVDSETERSQADCAPPARQCTTAQAEPAIDQLKRPGQLCGTADSSSDRSVDNPAYRGRCRYPGQGRSRTHAAGFHQPDPQCGSRRCEQYLGFR